MSAKVKTRFFNGRILRKHRLIQEDLWIEGNKIIQPCAHADRKIDLEGKILAPGYIDLQINGFYGTDFTRTPENWNKAAEKLPQFGVTSFLATVLPQPAVHYKKTLTLLAPLRESGAELLGIHLEGPFLNPQFAGAHAASDLHPEIGSISSHFGCLASVKMVTLAPELPGALQAIQDLTSQRIVAAAGHSSATITELQSAKAAGLRTITHLFNAMRPFHHREPGMIGAALTDSELFYSLIVDGAHLHQTALQLAWKAHPKGLFLVSDAMEAAGLGDGSQIGHRAVEIKNGKSVLAGKNTLAGSLLTLDQAVRNLHSWTGCSIIEAIEAASLKPAQVLGIDGIKGNLNIGSDADFNILDDHLKVQTCYVAGSKIYSAPPNL